MANRGQLFYGELTWTHRVVARVAFVSGPRRCTVVRPPIRANAIIGVALANELNVVAPSHAAVQTRCTSRTSPGTDSKISPIATTRFHQSRRRRRPRRVHVRSLAVPSATYSLRSWRRYRPGRRSSLIRPRKPRRTSSTLNSGERAGDRRTVNSTVPRTDRNRSSSRRATTGQPTGGQSTWRAFIDARKAATRAY